MPSTYETILSALKAALEAGTDAVVMRADDAQESFAVPPEGAILIVEGEPGAPELLMSPLSYTYEHGIELELYVTGENNITGFDALRVAVGAVLAADRFLGGAVTWLDWAPAVPNDDPIDGNDAIRTGLIPVTVTYTTSNPLT
ncbi:acyl-CoA transferase [Pelagovum pacificum]|uniref:Acyl-CoA transferase n=1 Tax=Pelagovum pacificum TaxID=2588711 RepID=A0A5C5GHJ2_9RHOB|nr:acyl-CoA transferase [Pelagovum pacificum]QQA43955.1 acyl-CoA transferase [Pelagovum pacificum]TNY32916.1 acyl-CoA transferase [Pelagovum pacificum]